MKPMGPVLCAVHQQDLPAQRRTVGRPFPFLSGSAGRLSVRLPALCRDEPGARQHGRAARRLPLVELPGACAWRVRHVAHATCRVSRPGYEPGRETAALSHAVPRTVSPAGTGGHSRRHARQFRTGQPEVRRGSGCGPGSPRPDPAAPAVCIRLDSVVVAGRCNPFACQNAATVLQPHSSAP